MITRSEVVAHDVSQKINRPVEVETDAVVVDLNRLTAMANEVLSLFPDNILGGRDNSFRHRPREINEYAFGRARALHSHIEDYLQCVGNMQTANFAIESKRRLARNRLNLCSDSLAMHMDFFIRTYFSV